MLRMTKAEKIQQFTQPLREQLERLEKDRHWATVLRQAVLKRMLECDDMAQAWVTLRNSNVDPETFAAAVESACKKAAGDTTGQTSTAKKKSLEGIIAKIRALEIAIEESTLPKDWAQFVEIESSTKAGMLKDPDEDHLLSLSVAWRNPHPVAWFPGAHPVTVPDLLEMMRDLLQSSIDGLSAPAIGKARPDSDQTAFVRHLGWELHREYEKHFPSVLMRAANAIYQPTNTWTADRVKEAWKGLPDKYKKTLNRVGISGKPNPMPP